MAARSAAATRLPRASSIASRASPRKAAPALIIDAVLDGELDLIVSPLLISELTDVLMRVKFAAHAAPVWSRPAAIHGDVVLGSRDSEVTLSAALCSEEHPA